MKLKSKKPNFIPKGKNAKVRGNDDGNTNKTSSNYWWAAFLVVLTLTIATRFYKVSEPDHVCWDETHFGKMANWYLTRTFFFDVHPPLGKMLIAASGYLTGYNGSYPFSEPGEKFNGTGYLGMRVFCTALGASVVPFSFVSVWEMTESLNAAILASALVLFDVGVITLTQYILLDPILLFFVMGSVMGIEKLNSCQNVSFSFKWWFWLSFTGFMIGCAISVKFVGFFVIAYVGLRTLEQLWNVLGDTAKPIEYTARHFAARALCLIIFPFLLYTGFFYIHLKVLVRSGNGDGFYSSAFQSQLIGNQLYGATVVKDVVYGSTVTIKSTSISGGYLHSHPHLYPMGFGLRQQQITSYMHKDTNNFWIFKRNGTDEIVAEELVRHGDFVKLVHVTTERLLRVTDEAAPITTTHFQATGFEEDNSGNFSDVWMIEKTNERGDDFLHAVTSQFKLVHSTKKCLLTATREQLPKWAYEQHEVTCSPKTKEIDGFWSVEHNDHPSKSLARVTLKDMAPSFLARFLESHAVMFRGNAGLKPSKGEKSSRPWQWPINYKGQYFSEGDKGVNRIYLLGNPIIWAANLVFMAVFFVLLVVDGVRTQRGRPLNNAPEKDHKRYIKACLWLLTGWSLHYIPFWTMGRILYFHHYFTALLFSSMLTGITIVHLLEIISGFLKQPQQQTCFYSLFWSCILTVIYSFYVFSPLTYGIDLPSENRNSSMHKLRWMDTWEF